jgi:hypothetical protein
MSQQQHPSDISIDQIPIDLPNTQTSEVDPADIPEEIRSITCGLASEHPPTNPLVVLKAARWWYIHGKVAPTPHSSGPSSGHVTSRQTRPAT